jgi:eukaryotic-like serine/threonine-protein kinase
VGQVTAITWSPDGTRIASASWDRAVQVWQAASGKQVWAYRPGIRMWTAEWSPNGRYLAAAGGGVVQVRETSNWRPVFSYPLNNYATAYATRWSPDSERLAAALGDGTAQVWDAITGKRVFTYRGHTAAVYQLA